MTIRTKVVIIIGVALLLTAGLLYATSRFTFMRGIEEIEERDTANHVEQVVRTLSFFTSDLESDTADWASWDDTYEFIEDKNEDYIESNLVDDTFITLKLNVMLFVHSSGRIVYTRAFDLVAEEEVSVPQDLLAQLKQDSLLFSHEGFFTNFLSFGRILIFLLLYFIKSVSSF